MVKISLCYTYMEDKSTFLEFYGRHHQLMNCYVQNICITDDHRYVNFVMDKIPPFYLVLHLSTNINVY